MVCLLCDTGTRISNSRYHSRRDETWRRHRCPRCLAVFTTRESADMSQYRVKDSSSLVVFVSTKLLMSIVDALAHRPDGVLEAGDIYETVAAKLRQRKRLVMSRRDITAAVESVLERFDNTAYVRYRSVHPLGS